MVPPKLCGMRYGLGIVALCTVLTGCHSVVAGTAQPADHLGPLPTTIAAPVNPSNPREKLLAAAQVATIVGETSMTEAASSVDPEHDRRVDPSACTPLALPNSDQLYHSYIQLYATLLNSDGKHDVAQVVSSYRDAAAAAGVVSYGVYSWKQCTAPFTLKQDDGSLRHLTPGPITGTDTRAAVSIHNQDTGRLCQHILAAKSIFVVEVDLCGDDGQAVRQADAVADQILAKIPA